MKLEIPIIVGFDDLESLLDDLKKLQTYKLFEGDEMVLVDIEDVAKVLMDHVKAKKSVKGDPINRRDVYDALECMRFASDEERRYGFSLLEQIPTAEPEVLACGEGELIAQPERPEQPESAREYCAECNHIEMCRWYPYEGCEFRSLPYAQPEKRVFSNMSDAEFEKWLYEHGICHPDIHYSIPCDAVPLLIDNAISELPSAQPKTGKWIYNGDCYKCNKCGTTYSWWADSQCSNFCPNCGVKMEGE